MSEKQWKHDELQADLASHLRASTDRVVWENMQLGPAGSPRPDCFTIEKSYSKFRPLAYEIKVSVADFRRDATAGKWQSYLDYSCAVIFAVPAGLIGKQDIPAGTGLIVRHEGVWRMARSPILKHVDTLPRDAWMKLVIDGILRQNHMPEPRRLSTWEAQRKIRKAYGDRIADLLISVENAETELEYAKARLIAETAAIEERKKGIYAKLEQERTSIIDPARIELCRALGLPDGATAWGIQAECERIAKRLNEVDEIKRLNRLFESVERAIESHKEPILRAVA